MTLQTDCGFLNAPEFVKEQLVSKDTRIPGLYRLYPFQIRAVHITFFILSFLK